MKVPRGLSGVAITDTTIAKSDIDGTLIYRGYDINELAKNASFEETAHLILMGKLPTKSELASFTSSLNSKMKIEPRVYEIVRDLPKDSHPMDVLRTAVSALGSIDKERTTAEQQLSIAAKMPVLVANAPRVLSGKTTVEPKMGGSYAENLLQMITGKRPANLDAWVFERILVFYMEHDLNASSFTVRVVASTLADPYAAVTAGIAALKGPLHGGANEAAMQALRTLKDAPGARRYVEKALAERRKVSGFGHRIYKNFDPRAKLSKEYLKQLLVSKGLGDSLFVICDAMEREMWERKKLPANLDFYAAPIFFSLGIPIPLYTPIFAASRVFGWIAHYNEQVEENKLIRPDATYVGRKDLKYVPISRR